GLLFGSIGIGIYLTADQWSIRGYEDAVIVMTSDDEDLPDDASVYIPAIVDLPGDPMVISLGGDGGLTPKGRSVERPDELDDPGISARVEILSDVMVSSSQRFMTTIPSSQEDFAFFQAQRMGARNAIAP